MEPRVAGQTEAVLGVLALHVRARLVGRTLGYTLGVDLHEPGTAFRHRPVLLYSLVLGSIPELGSEHATPGRHPHTPLVSLQFHWLLH